MSKLTNDQNNPSIVGIYNLGASSPEGGSHLVVLENGDYAIMHFGGIQTGRWEGGENNNYQFIPNLRESKFELFGRYNKDLKGETKIYFSGFENSETFIQLGSTKENEFTMQRVFNIGANCFSYPYVHTFKTVADSISFLFLTHNNSNNSICTIHNPQEYNDFVAYFIEIDSYSSQPFSGTFKDDKLYFEENGISERMPLDEGDEDIVYLKNMIDSEANRDTIYLNPSYNIFGEPDSDEEKMNIHEHHVFDEQKNAFIDTEYYVEGMENINSEESFEEMSIIYAYKTLTEFTKEPAKYKINENSLFQVTCD